MRRILLYGGAFDPPHLGHSRLLEAAIQEIDPDLTLVIPTAVSPHKTPTATPYADRACMARVFCDLAGAIRISGVEYTSRKRKSYTFQTVKRLERRYPDAAFTLLIGSDMLMTFDEWHRYRRLCTRVDIVAAVRRNEDSRHVDASVHMIEGLGGRVRLMEFDPLDISSTEIRKRVRAGRSLDGLVHENVERYIKARKLYLDAPR